MIGDDFTVCVNGYSLGGGLATLFGFFASTDERFTRNGPVKIFSYGMPYVASYSFADAFRHQERCKKVQHARFYNHNDIGELLLTTKVGKDSEFFSISVKPNLFLCCVYSGTFTFQCKGFKKRRYVCTCWC